MEPRNIDKITAIADDFKAQAESGDFIEQVMTALPRLSDNSLRDVTEITEVDETEDELMLNCSSSQHNSSS